jgi:tricarballylate dehydrogenase
MALQAGASPAGNWSGCHAVGWDRNAPEFGDLTVGDNFQKHSYPFAIMVNAQGKRFVNEGADFRNYTYAVHVRKSRPARCVEPRSGSAVTDRVVLDTLGKSW